MMRDRDLGLPHKEMHAKSKDTKDGRTKKNSYCRVIETHNDHDDRLKHQQAGDQHFHFFRKRRRRAEIYKEIQY
jgi:hypothetical protein